MADDLVTAAVGLVGTVVGGTISWWVNRRANQAKLAFDMHKEYNTRELSEIRTQAQMFLLWHPDDVSLSTLFDQFPKETSSVWLIAHFFQRLWLSIEHWQIKASLVPPLFGEKFIWWHQNCFEKQLFPVPAYSDVTDQLKQLRDWFRRHTDADKLDEWKRRAEMIRTRARQAVAAGLAAAAPSLNPQQPM